MQEIIKKTLRKERKIPFSKEMEEAVKQFTLTEKVLFSILIVMLALSSLTLLYKLNDSTMVQKPAHGGTLTEGIIGSPRFINPLLALSDADRDLTALVYSGLLKASSNGQLVPDLAESYSISPDGLTYTFTLKDKIFFHDGTPVTADDVVFTIQKAQDPATRSPKRANWDGVTVEKINNKEIKLTQPKAYAPFLENTTLGILPKHLWKDVSAEFFPFSPNNTSPIGSGPYQIDTIRNNNQNIPTYYSLVAFKKYALGYPYIKNIVLRFYNNEKSLIDAYNSGNVESITTISPIEAKQFETKGVRVEKTPLPRIFGVFFNQNQARVFANKEVRQALSLAVNKQLIVDKVLSGYGTVINSPIPAGLIQEATSTESTIQNSIGEADNLTAAKKILEKAGWKMNTEKGFMEKTVKKEVTPLTFSISTSNAPELKEAANMLKEMWEKIGAKVEVKIFEIGDLNQNVIRPRKYDALFFGEIVGRDLDLFAFWHSSQRNDPGLNIAIYTNIKADKALEEARTLSDKTKQSEQYRKFETEIKNDIPVIFTYSPDFLYILPKKVLGVKLGHITTPAERFLNINEWHIETEKVWKIFTKD